MKYLLSCYLLIFYYTANCNVGVFTGYGHSIELSSSDSVQMVSEEVTIIPGRGRFHFDGGIPGMDRVEYECKFTLKNLKDEEVKINAGFPLNTQFLEPPYNKDKSTSDLVVRYNFIVQEHDTQHSVKYLAGDKEKKLKNLFTWEMQFAAKEIKNLRITYSMPISMTLASTSQSWETKYEKAWYHSLESCMLEFFGYVTETGNSWAGEIESASFKVYTKGFEDYIKARPLLEGIKGEQLQKTKERFPVFHPTIMKVMKPEVWEKDENGFIKLTYENYSPKQNLEFYYYILSFPRNAECTISLIEHLHRSDFSNEDYVFTDKDYDDLRDIFLEFNGTKTKNPRIQKFLKLQKWFNKPQEEKIPEIVFETIKQRRR